MNFNKLRRFSDTTSLFFISALTLFVNQLFNRLISYTQTFHLGLILASASLIGGGLILALSARWPRLKIFKDVNWFVPILIPLGLASFALFQQPIAIFVTVGVLFGLLFLSIAQSLKNRADWFYAVEMFGSAAGGALFFYLSTHYLEEVSIGLIAGAMILTEGIRCLQGRPWSYLAATVVLNGTVIAAVCLHPLPSLISCASSDHFSKAVCLDKTGLHPVLSFPQLRGRSDLYDHMKRGRLELRNNGFFVGASFQNQMIAQPSVVFGEPRIADLHYPKAMEVFDMGPSIGGRLQTLKKYAIDSQIEAVEVDASLLDLQKRPEFSDYLPPSGSFSLTVAEGRSYLARNPHKFDLIDVSIEEVNSPSQSSFIDESTSLLFTKEALELYAARLKPGGYLLMETFYPKFSFGEGMAIKFLNGLMDAQGLSREALKDHVLLYSWDFTNSPKSQRFLSSIYKPDGFSKEEITAFGIWAETMNTKPPGSGNTTLIVPMNIPGTDVVYSNFFDQGNADQIARTYWTAPDTDDRPFRHQITRFPFSSTVYLWFVGFLFLFALLSKNSVLAAPKNDWKLFLLSAASGIVTFGLQYLLFYRTAVFLGTSLMQFSNFLLVPMLASAVGGAVSFRFQRARPMIIATSVALCLIFLFSSPLTMPRALTWCMIIATFLAAGMIFPGILGRSSNPHSKTLIYGINLFAGGFGLLLAVTAHSTIGWRASFIVVIIALQLLLWLSRVQNSTPR